MSQYKHLTFQERICIEESLDKRISINMIAKQLKKSRSTIAREIQRNRYQVSEPRYKIHPGSCPDFKQHVCSNLQKSPFVCNGCKSTTHCRNRFTAKYKYQARRAQVIYEDTLKESRTGISLSEEQMQALDNLVSPLLFQGQSIRAIYNEKFYRPILEL